MDFLLIFSHTPHRLYNLEGRSYIMLYFWSCTSSSLAPVCRLGWCKWSWGTGRLLTEFVDSLPGPFIPFSASMQGRRPDRVPAPQLIFMSASKTPAKPRPVQSPLNEVGGKPGSCAW